MPPDGSLAKKLTLRDQHQGRKTPKRPIYCSKESLARFGIDNYIVLFSRWISLQVREYKKKLQGRNLHQKNEKTSFKELEGWEMRENMKFSKPPRNSLGNFLRRRIRFELSMNRKRTLPSILFLELGQNFKPF